MNRLFNEQYQAGLSCLVLCSILFCHNSSAQNLFRNPFFEKIDSNRQQECSINFRYNDSVSDWQNLNTADYAHTSIPFTIRSGAVKIKPFSGNGMVGLNLIDMGDGALPEFLFQRVSVPIIPGTKYRISFRIHFRNLDKYFPEKIQVKTVESNPCNMDYSKMEGETFSIPIERDCRNDTAWILLSLQFSPQKTAKYLVIGSFQATPDIRKKRSHGSNYGIYAFFDDMELVDLTSGNVITPIVQFAEQTNPPTEKSSIMPLRMPDDYSEHQAIPSISFDHNSFEMAPVFIQFLTVRIPDLIKQDCLLLIEGHTDKTGSEDFNTRLAQKRAQVVADFFISNGYPRDRIQIKSFGSSKPVVMGEDDLSLSMNRRVDISQLCE